VVNLKAFPLRASLPQAGEPRSLVYQTRVYPKSGAISVPMCFSAQYEPHHYINLTTLAADSPVTAADCMSLMSLATLYSGGKQRWVLVFLKGD
jgi:hypothetical protein